MQAAVETPNSLSSLEAAEAIDLCDRVRAPDFYRRAQVTVCVLFEAGDTGQFMQAQLSPLT
jgi:hypothetical protein